MLRAALYVRVSTEEQVREGYSLDAQRSQLLEYAKRHEYEVVNIYTDEGVTARKKYTNRKALMRLLDDVKSGKIDIILFIKLDRWFRSISDYYKIQEVLDQHNVGWTATLENYDTTTANGRLYINIRLAVAQDECDRTSERIKFIFSEMIRNGERISGKTPTGYKVIGKRYQIDTEKAPMVVDLFETYLRLKSVRGTLLYANANYPNCRYQYQTMHNLLRNKKYIGHYRDNPHYCPPIISEEIFWKTQSLLDEAATRTAEQRKNPKYTYIFSGLVQCPFCKGGTSGVSHHKYHYYRCNLATRQKECKNHSNIREDYVENYVLDHIQREIIEYKKEYENLQSEEKDFSHLDKVLSSNFRDSYQYYSNSEKNNLWRTIIKSIEVNNGLIYVAIK